ncbi:hypothetical protein VISI1226_12326 [Vibrio sinaloensis DSM 21326]|uniref:Uncharacterized protein n=1 Tax=Vibrio sinaloensis DSM 21326 TaxID=945550 RepID=E8M2R2_PHOS4|nr:hypothetical protein VISI1226_12326 [Vibrio sinaloensis DSM 21326]
MAGLRLLDGGAEAYIRVVRLRIVAVVEFKARAIIVFDA